MATLPQIHHEKSRTSRVPTNYLEKARIECSARVRRAASAVCDGVACVPTAGVRRAGAAESLPGDAGERVLSRSRRVEAIAAGELTAGELVPPCGVAVDESRSRCFRNSTDRLSTDGDDHRCAARW